MLCTGVHKYPDLCVIQIYICPYEFLVRSINQFLTVSTMFVDLPLSVFNSVSVFSLGFEALLLGAYTSSGSLNTLDWTVSFSHHVKPNFVLPSESFFLLL